jgi:hypothetical protein
MVKKIFLKIENFLLTKGLPFDIITPVESKASQKRRGCSSSGRAPPCQGGGSEFEPRRPLQKDKSDSDLSFFLFFAFSNYKIKRPAKGAESGCIALPVFCCGNILQNYSWG